MPLILYELIDLQINTLAVGVKVLLRCIKPTQEAFQGVTGPDGQVRQWHQRVVAKHIRTFDLRGWGDVKQLVEHPLLVLSRPSNVEILENEITMIGPPFSLVVLKQSRFICRKTWNPPIYAPYHNSLIFGPSDITSVLKCDASKTLVGYPSLVPVLLGAIGTLVRGWNFAELVQDALQDILRHPINRVEAVHGIAYVSGFSKSKDITIHCHVINSHTALANALKTQGYTVNIPIKGPSILASHWQIGFKTKLAIVGMSGRFPEAEDPAAFWDLLSRGLNVHKTVPETLRKKNTSGASFGCWLNNPGYFDRKVFSISLRETPQVDPASRFALMTAYEAMEDAGMVPGSAPSTRRDRVGVFYGVTSNDWMENNSSQNIDTYFIAGGCRAFVPGRTSYFSSLVGQA